MLAGHHVSELRVRAWLAEVFPQVPYDPVITPLAADASTRRYYRFHWAETTPNGVAASYVLMVCTPWAIHETPDFLSVGRHLRTHGIRVPEVYGVAPADGLMCLEDYGDRTLARQWQEGSASDRLYWGRRAMQALVGLHTHGTQHYDAACPAFGLAFDVPKLLSELQFFRQHAIEGLWHQSLSLNAREDFEAIFHALCVRLADASRYVCHRDYHGWNIMALADGDVGVLDFQDARMGPQPYDLVSLLVDRGTPVVLGDALSQALLDYYLEHFQAEAGQAIDRDAFGRLFDYVAVQRCLKAIGTFAAMHVSWQRSQYLPYIAPTLSYLWPCLRRYDALQPLARLLRRFIPSEVG